MRRGFVLLLTGLALALAPAAPASADPAPAPAPAPVAPAPAPAPAVPAPARHAPMVPVAYRAPVAPTTPAAPIPPSGAVNVNVNVNGENRPANSLVILLGITLLWVLPALLLVCTPFTKVFMVLGIARNALGLTSMPPNQVLAGLALFISLFIMGPTLAQMNEQGLQPYLNGTKTQSQAFEDGIQPLRQFMLKTTRPDEIALMVRVSGQPTPANQDDLPMTTLVPAFVLSELRAAFIIGFVIFIPFIIIDMVVSASLMSLGMMMLPPVTVALPFKLLLFVLVNGWSLIITALVASYG
ncbi:flagellar biosynthetic protein FliP [Krasilnikovia cinnamomea]|uniref:Flagellar biosynthetic protein FliP n=1 Tax=Krasilnikovia cinnamomea TaxID=349313 RepID=A0A4Q7ZJ12_9ACTN|nr:flagellar type III secretion system pore protein FliP [Krasilnikovia cinnamomea]RZU50471.1 flagellar biosynthetic protein FliP [Krasilnikovia cinnamomea]